MVGKGDTKTSRIFHQCYIKCCKLQNLTPLNNVAPSANGKVLDFCVDRIKYADWPPILNALCSDLSLHSLAIRCRQQVKTILEQIDCERLAKTVNKRAVILTKFMMTNLLEAVCQLLADTTLLSSLLLEGLPIRIPYLNPLCDALLANNSLRHVALPRCLIGDAGCLAICKAVRCLPNILTLDLSGCELTLLGASYIADLMKYQKIHRYSENWVHTLRYRQPNLETMAGLRRISLCGNAQLGDAGVAALLSVLSDDLWIKAVDLQNCSLTELTTQNALQSLQSNTTLVVLDLRHNADICLDSLAKVRAVLRKNENEIGEQYLWLGNSNSNLLCSGDSARGVRPTTFRTTVNKDRMMVNQRNAQSKYTSSKTPGAKKEKEYAEELEEQLQEETSHRQQLEELNAQLIDQLKQLKQQQIHLWTNNAASSGSEQSFEESGRSTSSSSSCSVPIDQNTLTYIQQAFRDIYAFIKNNQCEGNCQHEVAKDLEGRRGREVDQIPEESSDEAKAEEYDSQLRVNIVPKKAHSTHVKLTFDDVKVKKITKSAHLLGHIQHIRESMQTKPEMIETHIGDTTNLHNEEKYSDERNELKSDSVISRKESPKSRSSGSLVSDSSDTLVSPHHVRPQDSPRPPYPHHSRASLLSRASSHSHTSKYSRASHESQGASPSPSASPRALNPRDALYSSSDDSS